MLNSLVKKIRSIRFQNHFRKEMKKSSKQIKYNFAKLLSIHIEDVGVAIRDRGIVREIGVREFISDRAKII